MNNSVFEQISFSYRNSFPQKVLHYFSDVKNIVFLNSNHTSTKSFIAISDNNKCDENSWQFGFISYDYKNQIEKLSSNHPDGIQFPEKHFFTPQLLFVLEGENSQLYYNRERYSSNKINKILNNISTYKLADVEAKQPIAVTSRITKTDYLAKVSTLKNHIQLGDIYEINFCQEFYAEDIQINPIDYYFLLNEKSPTPFSCFIKQDDKYLLCASPERFIQKTGSDIISQPIKGTIKRGKDQQEDEQLKKALFNDQKERSENVMIVDLVRNDLSKIAQKASVKVDELCGIYTFPQVHQMISTVRATLKENTSFEEIIQALFPMGSMTGAPKISAMQLIEKYEATKRGIYSGTVGYITPEKNVDFNVVIRSITYNASRKYLSFMVGGAITALSVPEKEYEECLLKAKAMIEVLKG
ncbi:MAG: aminodeoxychorismate synthase component I [Flavobacteriales bacterium]|nr:aminodeoxychorismate synthase component I [Flavobacteriales bacterium]